MKWSLPALIAAALCLCLLTSCKPPPAPSDSLDSIAQTYLRIALALGERDPDSLDYAIAPQSLKDSIHRAYPTLDEIDRQTARLLIQLDSARIDPRSRDRVRFLALQLRAIQTRTAMLRGHLLAFDAEAQALFATTRQPDTEAPQRVSILRQISTLLPPGPQSLAARYAAYDRQFLVPPARIESVMRASLAGCRRQTVAFLTLPLAESVELKFVRNQPWSAFSRYEGRAHSLILLNLDLPITVDGALELACHEGYPGHHVFNSLHDLALAQRDHRPEAQVQLTFSPQAYLSEAAASYAPRLAFPLEARVAFVRDVLFPLAGLDRAQAERHVRLSRLLADLSSAQPAIARDFLDGRLDFVRAQDEFARQTLMLHADAELLYLNEYRSYILAYTDGERSMARSIGGVSLLDQAPDQASPRAAWERLQHLSQTDPPAWSADHR